MVTISQITPIPISSLEFSTTLSGDEPLPIVQLGQTVKTPINQLPQGMTAGVIVFGSTGGSPFPNYRTLKAGNFIQITDGGPQGDLTISVIGSSGGPVSVTGSPVAGNLTKFSSGTSITNGDLSGDVTTSGTLTTTISDGVVTFRKMSGLSMLNIEDYGAVGNGTTDDSTAIQAALDAAASSSIYKTVYVPDPPSGFAVGVTLQIPAGVTLLGLNRKGGEQSRIKPVSGFTSPLITSKNYSTSRILRPQVVGVFLDGSSTTLTAIDIRCQEGVFRDITIKNCFTYGIKIGGYGSGASEQALNNIIENCFLAGSGGTSFYDGIFLDYHTADTTIINNYVEQASHATFNSRGFNDIVEGNHFFNAANLLYSETSCDKTIVGNYFERSSAEAIYIIGGSSVDGTLNATITGNLFRNINTGGTAQGIISAQGSDISTLAIAGNSIRRDGGTSYTANYFTYFNGITPANAQVYGNTPETGVITTGQTNLTSVGLRTDSVNNSAITYAKIQDVSATDKVLGRSTAGSGVVEEITFTSAARTFSAAVSAAAERTVLGIGTGDSPTFTGLTLSGLTAGSVLYAGTAGVISQNNANLFWDNSNGRFGIGTNVPNSLLHCVVTNTGTTSGTSRTSNFTYAANPASTSSAAYIAVDAAVTGTVQDGINITNAVLGIRSIVGSASTALTASPTIGQILGGTFTASHNPTISSGTCLATTVQGLAVTAQVIGTNATASNVRGILSNTSLTAAGTSATLIGYTAQALLTNATASATTCIGYQVSTGTYTGTITSNYGHSVQNLGNAQVSRACGMHIADQTTSSRTCNILIGATTIPVGNFSAFVTTSVAATKLMILQGAASQSGSALEIQNSAGTVLSCFDANGRLSLGTTTPSSILHLSGSYTQSAWQGNGIGLRIDAGTYTDSSSSGTVTLTTAHSIQAPTFAASSATTYTSACTLYLLGAPIAGTNVTMTTSYVLYAAGGNVRLIGNLGFGESTPTTTSYLILGKTFTDPAATVSQINVSSTANSITSNNAQIFTGYQANFRVSQGGFNLTASTGIRGASITAYSNGASGTTTGVAAYYGITGNVGAGTVTNAYTFYADSTQNSGGGTLTNSYGLYVEAHTAATNIYATYLNIAAATNRWNVYAGGSAENYMAGALSIGTAVAAATLHLAKSESRSAWTTNGVGLRIAAATYTDTSSSGTVATSVANAVGIPTFAASSSTTYTNGATLYIAGVPVAGTNVTITNAYALMVAAGTSRFVGALSLGDKITTYNGVATAGQGVPSIYGSGRSTAQTAAVASVAAYTVGASDSSFLISANVLVTASTTHSFAVTCSYTDEGNTARVLTLTFSQLAGTLVAAITNVTGVGPYSGAALQIRAKAATAITIATSGTFTSVTYNVEGAITCVS